MGKAQYCSGSLISNIAPVGRQFNPPVEESIHYQDGSGDGSAALAWHQLSSTNSNEKGPKKCVLLRLTDFSIASQSQSQNQATDELAQTYSHLRRLELPTLVPEGESPEDEADGFDPYNTGSFRRRW